MCPSPPVARGLKEDKISRAFCPRRRTARGTQGNGAQGISLSARRGVLATECRRAAKGKNLRQDLRPRHRGREGAKWDERRALALRRYRLRAACQERADANATYNPMGDGELCLGDKLAIEISSTRTRCSAMCLAGREHSPTVKQKEEKQQQKQQLPMARATERSRLPFPLRGLATHGSATQTGSKERSPAREDNGGTDL